MAPHHVLSLFHHRRALKDIGNEQQASPAWGHGGETGEWGRVSLTVSHLISRLLFCVLLCTGHMYSRQRRGEVDGPLCREASITSLVMMQRNDQLASGTEQTLMHGLKNKKKILDVQLTYRYYHSTRGIFTGLHLCGITMAFGAWAVIINRSSGIFEFFGWVFFPWGLLLLFERSEELMLAANRAFWAEPEALEKKRPNLYAILWS